MSLETSMSTTQGALAAPLPALELIGVRKVFRSDLMKGPQVAIDGLSCRFLSGECTGLLGHNGAGKTTTIRLILGLVRPDGGQILFEGHPLTTKDKHFIGYMPEVNKLPAGLTPEEILKHQLQLFAPPGLRSGADRRAAVDAKLAEVSLTEHRKKRIGHLSKGMARRLAWAQATIHLPRLLILDEPSSGLDPLGRRRMLSWIEAEKRRGTSILLCTHELHQVATLCDEFVVLRRGHLALSSHGDGGASAQMGANGGGRQRYNIQVSGLDEAGLRRLSSAEDLPDFVEVKHEGFLAMLSFADYEGSARWLGALLAKGYVVTRFGDESSLGEDELMRFFEGEN